jgi:hypothetical protein
MIVRYDTPFEISRDFEPKGDQAQAIEQLLDGLDSGYRFQTLLGATGTGKTYTMASVIARAPRDTVGHANGLPEDTRQGRLTTRHGREQIAAHAFAAHSIHEDCMFRSAAIVRPVCDDPSTPLPGRIVSGRIDIDRHFASQKLRRRPVYTFRRPLGIVRQWRTAGERQCVERVRSYLCLFRGEDRLLGV